MSEYFEYVHVLRDACIEGAQERTDYFDGRSNEP